MQSLWGPVEYWRRLGIDNRTLIIAAVISAVTALFAAVLGPWVTTTLTKTRAPAAQQHVFSYDSLGIVISRFVTLSVQGSEVDDTPKLLEVALYRSHDSLAPHVPLSVYYDMQSPAPTSHRAARELGQRHNAALVVWGTATDSDSGQVATINITPVVAAIQSRQVTGYGVARLMDRELFQGTVVSRVDFAATFLVAQAALFRSEYGASYRVLTDMLARPQGIPSRAVAVAEHYAGLVSTLQDSFVQAKAHFVKAVAADSTYLPPIVELSSIYAASNNIPRARHLLERVASARPADMDGFRSRAVALFRLGRAEDCIRDASVAIDLGPPNPLALLTRASCFGSTGMWNAAFADAVAATDLSPRLAIAYSAKGDYLLQLGAVDRALVAFDSSLALVPNTRALVGRGLALAARGQTGEAVAAYRRALATLHTQDHVLHNTMVTIEPIAYGAIVYLNLSSALYSMDSMATAAAVLRQGIATYPTYALLHFNLACLNARGGESAAALRALDRSLRLGLLNHASKSVIIADADMRLLPRQDVEILLANYSEPRAKASLVVPGRLP